MGSEKGLRRPCVSLEMVYHNWKEKAVECVRMERS